MKTSKVTQENASLDQRGQEEIADQLSTARANAQRWASVCWQHSGVGGPLVQSPKRKTKQECLKLQVAKRQDAMLQQDSGDAMLDHVCKKNN